MDTQAPATAADVAKLAGVSKATVSYVLSGRGDGRSRISDSTVRRVTEAAETLRYSPNQSARALRRRVTERICLVLPSLGIPFYDLLARDLRVRAANEGYSTVIAMADETDEKPLLLDQLRKRMADGVVFLAPRFENGSVSTDDLAELARLGVAVVVMSNGVEGAPFDLIHTTAAQATAEAIEHLTARGHRRIAFIGHTTPPAQKYGRHADYRAALAANGLPYDEQLILTGAGSRAEAYRSARDLIQRADRPTAIYAASDMAAMSSMWAARDFGLRVPDDLAVIGVGNIPEATVMQPTLSSIGPKANSSDEIAELLLSRLRGEADEPRTRIQEWELVLRESS